MATAYARREQLRRRAQATRCCRTCRAEHDGWHLCPVVLDFAYRLGALRLESVKTLHKTPTKDC